MTDEGGLLLLPLLAQGSHISTIHGLTLKGWENPSPFESKFESSLCYRERGSGPPHTCTELLRGLCSLYSCYSLTHREGRRDPHLSQGRKALVTEWLTV